MQLILSRKTVGDRHIRSLQIAGSCLKKKALQVIVLVYICVAISV